MKIRFSQSINPAVEYRCETSSNFFTHLTAVRTAVKLLFIMLWVDVSAACAQDPTLPPTNLGLANVFDGVAGKPGFLYQGYTQVFQTSKLTGDRGEDLHSDLKVNSLLQMNQFIYLSKVKVMGANLGFTLLVPVVKISATNDGQTPKVNPGVLGDIIKGTALQWSDKMLFDKSFSHRLELDVSFPVGSYQSNYDINPSTHAYTFGLYHAFTLMLSKRSSLNVRNQINYNAHTIGSSQKAGAYYNGNYSIDFAVLPNLRLEAVSYFLDQFIQDSFSGSTHYYIRKFDMRTTKERVLGFGPGLAYFTPKGVLFEVKTFFEAAAVNRAQGYRSTLRIAIPLN